MFIKILFKLHLNIPMCGQMITEYISHGYNIMFITINGQTVHSQILRKESLSMSFNNVLKINK